MNYIYNDELYHHGIRGQKWGLRRYQYKDMSLTPEGREHYGVGPPDGSAAARSGGSSSSSTSVANNSPHKNKFWTDERKATAKKVAIAGAAVAGTALVAYGAYKLGEQRANNSIDIGREVASSIQPQQVTMRDVINSKIEAKRRDRIDARLDAKTQAYRNKLIRKEKKKELKREYKALKDANKRELKMELKREKAEYRAEQKEKKRMNKDMDKLQATLARDKFIDKNETSKAMAKAQKAQERTDKINNGKAKVNGFIKTTTEYTNPASMRVYNDVANDFLKTIDIDGLNAQLFSQNEALLRNRR